MERNRFVVLAFVAFGCVLASFVTLGFGRLLVGYRNALVFAAPLGLVAFALVVVLFASSVWTAVTGGAATDGGAETPNAADDE